MGTEHLGRTFKSGNSVALRLPKRLGFKEGDNVKLVELAPGTVRIEAVPEATRKIDVGAFWGKGAGLKPLTREDRVFEERELDWEGKRLNEDG